MITVIMTAYNRPYTLEQQYAAIKNQTVGPSKIYLWYNKPPESEHAKFEKPDIDVIKCDFNAKFFGRFAWAFMASTPYIAIFDDDTIPGKRWFENCLETEKSQPGIMGTIGVILQGKKYSPYTKVGWHTGNSNPEEVDLVGHAWFFRKEYLKYMWQEEPFSYDNGEDIHFSYTAQKYGEIQTIVPPHPKDNHQLWGSIPDLGSKYGNDANANYKKSNHGSLRNEIAEHCIKNGWKTVKMRKK